MALTLKSLQAEMHQSFANMAVRIDERFAEVDKRFDKVDKRFDEMEERIDKRFNKVDKHFNEMEERMDKRFDQLSQDIASTLSPYFNALENILDDHEKRITVLEKARQ